MKVLRNGTTNLFCLEYLCQVPEVYIAILRINGVWQCVVAVKG